MKRSTGPSKTTNLFDSVQRHLNMYALVLGAVGFSLLALTQPAEAKIVYTPTDVPIFYHKPYNLDLDNDGLADFEIFVNEISGMCGGKNDYWLRETPVSSNSAEADPFGALALAEGERIGNGESYQGGSALMADVLWYRGATCQYRLGGHWVNASDRYLALKFKIRGKTHYGWARLSVDFDRYRYTLAAKLTGYAYETIPGKSIKAGATKGQDETSLEEPEASLTAPTSEKATPGTLALGTRALSIWRRLEAE